MKPLLMGITLEVVLAATYLLVVGLIGNFAHAIGGMFFYYALSGVYYNIRDNYLAYKKHLENMNEQ